SLGEGPLVRKLLTVFKREYLQTVRKKSFVVMTILFPFLLGALLIVPAFLATRSFSAKRIAVLDGTGKLKQAFDRRSLSASLGKEVARQTDDFRRGPMPELVSAEYAAVPGDPKAAAAPYMRRLSPSAGDRLDGILVIPADALSEKPGKLTYYSRSST